MPEWNLCHVLLSALYQDINTLIQSEQERHLNILHLFLAMIALQEQHNSNRSDVILIEEDAFIWSPSSCHQHYQEFNMEKIFWFGSYLAKHPLQSFNSRALEGYLGRTQVHAVNTANADWVWMLCASANTESIWKKHLMCITSTFSQAPHIDLSHFLSSHSLSQSQNPWIPINFSFFPLSSFTRIKNLLLIIHNVWNTSCNSPHILLLSVTLSLWWWPRY